MSEKDYDEIEHRILEETCGGILYYSTCMSNAITGIGLFKSIESNIFFPSNLKRAIDKIARPVQMVEAR